MEDQAQKDTIGDYRARLDRFKVTDQERNDTLYAIVDELEKLQSKCQQFSDDLEREQEACRSLQKQNRGLLAVTQRRGFVLVLLDADGDEYIFCQRFLDGNALGGKEAADEFHAKITEYVKSLQMDTENTDIVVRAYANIKSLQTACVKNGKMKASSSLGLFVQGFNQRQSLYDFVDVGTGKEGADNKIRECLNFYIGNFQCKHIILGVCHDAGYVPYLNRFDSNGSTQDRITLMYGTSLNPAFHTLRFSHLPLKLNSVFAPNGAIAAARRASTPKEDKDSIPAASTPLEFGGTGSTHVRENRGALSQRLELLRDADGKRMDKPLKKVDPNNPYLDTLRRNKLCSWYYLRGKCEGDCDKNHVPGPLNGREYDCLWYLARQGLCYKTRKGKDCDDPRCIYGHQKG